MPSTTTRIAAALLYAPYSSAAGFATMVSPLYWPQLMQTRWGTRGAPQFLQGWTIGWFAPDFRIQADRC
jgi:hypothetical protein